MERLVVFTHGATVFLVLVLVAGAEGRGLRAGVAHLAVGFKDTASHLSRRLVPPPPMIGPSCDSTSLAMKIMDSCGSGEGASSDCCEAIITAVDTRGCLCNVTSERFLIEADISLIGILQLYNKCGGVRTLSDDLQCEDVQDGGPPCSQCPPTPSSGWLSGLRSVGVVTLVFTVVIFIILIGLVGWIIYMFYEFKLRTTLGNMTTLAHMHSISNTRARNVILPSDIANIGLPYQNLGAESELELAAR
ncbi:uncharacterized protein LOC133915709 isoform X2 [Phragmites australis]|uniref:uncharacterized protein LOC133915709 isoform X2 n=1 Tax=Phragmites australis TaxID=29695 RepID=UPI002D77A39E|nr:uncharacterized protein LOC133915709 isoform X2 [Phragmites australis]